MGTPGSPRLRIARGGYDGAQGQWNHFEKRRHRMQPPEPFDEAAKRFEKYQQLTTDSICEDVGEDLNAIDADLGLRKAHFFDSCLRADRSVERPSCARPLLPPVGVRPEAISSSPRESRQPTEEDVPKRNTLHPLNFPVVEEGAPLLQLSRLDSSMLDLVSQCRRVRLHPATTGLVRSEREKLKLEYGFLTDERAEAINDTLKVTSSEVRQALFRSNGLSASGAGQLLEALPEQLESVDLSQNDLSHGIGWCRAFRRLTKLRSLTLSDCQLADGACVELLNNLFRCRSLARIDLSCNAISAGAAFQPLLKRFNQLEELDLHWNHFGGESASALLQGVIDCRNGQLQSLNLSWNPLGKFGAEETCQVLVRLFKETTTLKHLDISRCDLSVACCRTLAEGLKENRTIVGLHVSGNEAHVDAQGYLVPRASREEAESTLSLAEDEDSCCWLCNCWRETRLCYTPGISGPDASEVWAFTSIDGFVKPIKMQRVKEDFITYVMAAPGPLRFVFQAGAAIMCSRTAPQVDLREMVTAMRGGVGFYSRTSVNPAPGEDGPVLRLRRARLNGEEGEVGDVMVSLFSTTLVEPRGQEEPVCSCYVPRQPIDVQLVEEPQVWSLETSLFAPHFEPLSTKQFRERCFDADWAHCRIVHMLPDEAERLAVRDMLRQHYAELKVLYTSLCSVDLQTEGNPLGFGMGVHEYTHMLVQHNLVGEELSLEEADALFLAAALPSKDAYKWLPPFQMKGRVLQRHGFFGLLTRLAICVARGEQGAGKPDQVRKALQYLIMKHLMYPYAPMKNNFRAVQWRETVLHTQEVEAVFRKHMQAVVDPLFSAFARGYYLQPEDWFRMLDCLEVFPCGEDQMNAWDRAWAWQASAMSQVNELTSPRCVELVFVEFLEALARIVALIHSRAAAKDTKESWDYGLGTASPSTIFCLAKGVNDKLLFRDLLEDFLTGAQVKKALP